MLKRFLILILILAPLPVLPQTVDSLVREGIRNNPLLKAREYQIEAAKQKAESVNALPPAEVGIGFNEVPVNSLNIWNGALSNSLSITQMFHLGGKLSAMTEAEKKNVPVAQSDLDVTLVDLSTKVKMSYYSLWQIERKIEIQKENINLLEQLINSADVLYQVNRLNQADILTLKSELATNQTQLLNLQNQREVEIINLNRLLGRKLDSREIYTLKEIPTDSLIYSDAQLEEMLVKNNPALQKMLNMQKMNEAMIDASKREAYPDLMLQGMLMRMPNGMTVTANALSNMSTPAMPGTDYAYSLMASVTLPFLPWSSNKYKAKELELNATNQGIEFEKNDMQREMGAQLKSELAKMRNALDRINLYSNIVIPLYRQAMESQATAFQNGKAAINIVIDQNRMLLMQEMNYYMAQADYRMALAEIEMLTVTKITGK